MTKKLLCLITFCCLVISCEILRKTPFDVIAWSPGDVEVLNLDDVKIAVTFSSLPNTMSVENSFSLIEDGKIVAGKFLWQDRCLIFKPNRSLNYGANYSINISKDACDVNGVSMDSNFEGHFTTIIDKSKPAIISTTPMKDGAILKNNDNIVVKFSKKIDKASFRNNISVTPILTGLWNLSSCGTEVIFSPFELWKPNTQYEVNISAMLKDEHGNKLGCDYSFRFNLHTDNIMPEVIALSAIDKDGNVCMELLQDIAGDNCMTVNKCFDAAWGLRITFSKPVTRDSVLAKVFCSDKPNIKIAGNDKLSKTFEMYFDEKPKYNQELLINVLNGIEDEFSNSTKHSYLYRVLCNNQKSKPPVFIGMCYLQTPNAEFPSNNATTAIAMEDSFTTINISNVAAAYPVATPVKTRFELYFDVAPDTSLNHASLMSAIKFYSTNSSLTFDIDKIIVGLDTASSHHALWLNYIPVTIYGRLTNGLNSGLLTISVDKGLKDMRGNSTHQMQELVLLK